MEDAMTIPCSTYENTPAASRLSAFAPFVAWFLLMPPAALENSTVAYGNAVSFAAIYLVGLLGGALAARSAGERGRDNIMVAFSGAGAVAGVGFAVIAEPTLRFLLCGVVAAIAGALLALWSTAVRSALTARSLSMSLGFTAVVSLTLRGLLAFMGLAANLYSATTLIMLMLSVLLAVSAVALASASSRAGNTARGATTSHAPFSAAPKGGQIPAMVLCAASLAALFAQGLLFTPHYLDWEACAIFRALVDAAIAVGCLVLVRQKGPAAPWALEGAKTLGVALALSGLALCVVGNACEAAGFALLGSASDVLLLAVLACTAHGNVTAGGEKAGERATRTRSEFQPLLLIATGQGWAFATGSALKSWLGLGPSAFMALYLGGFALLALALAAALGQMWLTGASRARLAVDGCDNSRENARAPFAPKVTPSSENLLAKTGDAASGADVSDTILYASEDNMQQQQAARETAAALKVIGEHRQEALAPFGLSPRETEIALLMMDGLTIAAAAEKMGVAVGTAKFHLGNIYKKAGIQSKADLIALGRRYEYEIAEREARAIDDSSAEDNG